MPAISVPTSATTAGWPVLAAAITSATANTGSGEPGVRLWSSTWMAWSRSSSEKSRSLQIGIRQDRTLARRSPLIFLPTCASGPPRGARVRVGWRYAHR
jgi:hypothetical protein